MDTDSTRLAWRATPDLLLNGESLGDVITGLRSQIQTLEKNELLSGTALPLWLIKALAEVASNVDAVVECQALRDEVTSLQKEVLDLRHEMLLIASNTSAGATAAYSPTPHHRQSTSRSRTQASSTRLSFAATALSKDVSDDLSAVAETSDSPVLSEGARPVANGVSAQYVETMLKPLWDSVHHQTNEFSALKQTFKEAKDTVARLQAEIKRRDAVIKARNEKHESVVQTEMNKLNESLRSCITRNDLINAEQRIGIQSKTDRQRVLDELNTRANKLLEDMLMSRSDQEDINSSNGEMMETLIRRQNRTEEIIADFDKKHENTAERLEGLKNALMETTTNLEMNIAAVNTLEEKATSFEETQKLVTILSVEVAKASRAHDELKASIESRMADKVAESVTMLRKEITAVQTFVNDISSQNLEGEVKALAGRIDAVGGTVTDNMRKVAAIQKQLSAADDHNKTQFLQTFDSIERMQHSLSTLSEESIHLSYTLQRATDHGDKLTKEVQDYKQVTDDSIIQLQTLATALRSDHEKLTQSMDSEFTAVKSQLFHFEEVTSAQKRDLEETQAEVNRNFKNQHHENQTVSKCLDGLHTFKKEIVSRQDATESQLKGLQVEIRAEIQAATTKVVAVVDKESDRMEALYASFQHKQEHFADVVSRSSLRNMDLVDMKREIDRMCENFVSECWKFETSARSSSKSSARSSSDNNGGNRKHFNDRQQQLLVRDCQFIADLIVARAEYEILQLGCNKDVRNQHAMDQDMLEQQASILEKIRGKIYTKIMNNKNIGEQYDRSALDRRELYISTINNMLNASMKRRTLVGDGSSNSAHHETNALQEDTVLTSLNELVETKASHGPATKAASRHKPPTRDAMGTTAAALSNDTPPSRSTLTPTSNYVFRAGFRLPKASAPSTPMTPYHKDLVSRPLSSRSAFDLSNESTGSTKHCGPPSSETTRLQSLEPPLETLRGWDPDETSSMAKAYSLPVLKQQ